MLNSMWFGSIVCTKIMQDVRDSMAKADISKKDKVEAAIGAVCANEKLSSREKKVCYYIDPIKRSVAQPFSTGIPAERVCKRINQSNPEICTVKFPIKTEKMEKKDLTKLRVKQLKSILGDRGVECKGCIEKEEFIKKVEDTAHLDSEF
uniref:Mesencephalic astrocyte-derived neurotrophic factor homolog n=1 Tax=Proboscia inermis TaxID=420281 RepID=A0A7S0C2I3_9STRA|mmetsp:Transcript_22920/g.23285  ORF Transcript_22920/g.23285 Transcript_22920/m.23285 type:complete len:149 (+) Transcript_22920:406-852(+)